MKFYLYIILILSVDWDYNNKKDQVEASKVISNEYKEYCKANYKFFGKVKNHHLNKLIVIFRHGDRAPLKNFNSEWSKKKCVKCLFNQDTISNCKNANCNIGDLTITGFKQAQELGKFIKKNYEKLLFPDGINEKDIYYRVTKVKRTHSTLMGVMKGLRKKDSINNVNSFYKDDSLLRIKNCSSLDQLNSNNFKVNDDTLCAMEKMDIQNGRDLAYLADEIRCAMCNKIKLDISNENDIINKILKLSNNNWSKQMDNVQNNENARTILFGRFGNDLLNLLSCTPTLSLISAHDGSLGMILSALSSKIQNWPSYASAIFIEIWSKSEKQYVRMIYNNKKLDLDGYDDDMVPIGEFIKYVSKLSPEGVGIESLCQIKNTGKNNSFLIANKNGSISKYYLSYF
ncbi:acid phosphatase [Vairimorpha necatrix]|uniref:Acid phosphatase n=1 Tax=Vairimorpha necatrix TaxID=6039 RepID=A0AAX4JAY6_9MICR